MVGQARIAGIDFCLTSEPPVPRYRLNYVEACLRTAASSGADETNPSSELEGVVRYAEANVPTLYGDARFVVFRERRKERLLEWPEHVAICFGLKASEPSMFSGPGSCLVRVHSECLTSEVFGSLKCDCREQLHRSLEILGEKNRGVLLYLRQEGRGIGLGNKIKAYALQEKGVDTIEANHQLGFETDLRKYDIAAHILKDLGIHAVDLLTNNPEKVEGLLSSGIQVVSRISIEIEPNLHSAPYLDTKRKKMGHLMKLLNEEVP